MDANKQNFFLHLIRPPKHIDLTFGKYHGNPADAPGKERAFAIFLQQIILSPPPPATCCCVVSFAFAAAAVAVELAVAVVASPAA